MFREIKYREIAVESLKPVTINLGGFQLLDLTIAELKSHMTF